jgi:hypothetical protein
MRSEIVGSSGERPTVGKRSRGRSFLQAGFLILSAHLKYQATFCDIDFCVTDL